MRFIGLVMVLVGVGIGYFLGFKGTGDPAADVATARTRLAQLLNLPGLNPPTASSSAAAPSPSAAAGGAA